ncbi:MAG: M20/M25/M40 family metallo-hydrolase [Anaerolineae bacterium]
MTKSRNGDGGRETAWTRPGALAVGLVVLALVLALVVLRLEPPRALGSDAPGDVFSAGRAMDLVGELLAEGRPHPVGSAANDVVRERIVAHLEGLGYEVEIQEAVTCREGGGRGATCVPVKNVVTRLPGQVDGPAVMLMAHYDSVGGGPGAADDTSSVAEILEMARIFMADGPQRNPVVLLFTDGEEVGLMGAQAFVEEHPWARDLGAVINLEARGSTGQSLMFETSQGNAWLIEAYAGAVPRPSANSLSYEIYQQLPNDTDLTVFKEAGIAGLNFSFIGEPQHYHTALDNVAELDPRSVQHQGESALAVARALTAADLATLAAEGPAAGNAAYLDILGLFELWWPAAWTLPLSLATLLLLLAAAAVAVRQRQVTVGRLLLGLLAALLCLVLAIVLGMGLVTLIVALGNPPQPWWAHPLPTRAARWAGAFLSGGLMAAAFGRRAGLWGLGLGAWLLWALLAVVLSLTLAGATVFLLLPAAVSAVLLAAVVFLGRAGSAGAREGVLMVGMAVAGLLCLPLALVFETATGFDLNPAITLAVGLVATTLLPLLALPRGATRLRRLFLLGSAGVMVAAVVAALLVPPYSEDRPQPLNLYYALDAETGQARWLSVPYDDVTPPPLRQEFGPDAEIAFPWSEARYLALEAENTGLAAPALEIVSEGEARGAREVTVRLRSPRGAEAMDLVLPGAPLYGLTVAGQALNPGYEGGYYTLSCYGRACDGLEVTMELGGGASVAGWVVDYSLGLPPAGAWLLDARPATAVPVQEGDLTVVWAGVEF